MANAGTTVHLALSQPWRHAPSRERRHPTNSLHGPVICNLRQIESPHEGQLKLTRSSLKTPWEPYTPSPKHRRETSLRSGPDCGGVIPHSMRTPWRISRVGSVPHGGGHRDRSGFCGGSVASGRVPFQEPGDFRPIKGGRQGLRRELLSKC